MASLTTLIKQGVTFPAKFISGRAVKPMQTLQDIKPDDGAVVEIDGKKVAAYKDAKNNLTTLSPVCTHLGCIVAWNSAEKAWNCPCHGSKFSATGTITQGPAQKDLEKITV